MSRAFEAGRFTVSVEPLRATEADARKPTPDPDELRDRAENLRREAEQLDQQAAELEMGGNKPSITADEFLQPGLASREPLPWNIAIPILLVLCGVGWVFILAMWTLVAGQ